MKSIRSGVLSAERGGKLVDLDLAHADVEVELDRAGALVTVHDLLVRHRDAVVDHPEEVRLAGAHPRGDLDLHACGQLDGEVAEAHRCVDLQGLAPVDADVREVDRALADAQLVAVLYLLDRARRPRAVTHRARPRDVPDRTRAGEGKR